MHYMLNTFLISISQLLLEFEFKYIQNVEKASDRHNCQSDRDAAPHEHLALPGAALGHVDVAVIE